MLCLLNTNLLPTTNHNRIQLFHHLQVIEASESRLTIYTRCSLMLADRRCQLFLIFLSLLKSWARCHGLATKVLPLNALGSYLGTGSNLGCSTSHIAPCLWPGKAAEDGPMLWDSAHMWETQKTFLNPGLYRHSTYRPLRSIGE